MPSPIDALKPGGGVGPYAIVGTLGRGGNARVFVARSSGGPEVALKVLSKHNRYAYQRFRDEIAALRRLAADRGVLPILDASLPEHPSPRYPAALTMPIAEPISKALKDAPLDHVIQAMHEVAETLARLHAQSIHHRDIKPDNLYRHEVRYKVGDFGLVDYPGKVAITTDAQKLGPMYYHAPEMLTSASRADGAPADVFSFCKTLWVLTTGSKYPLEGEHRYAASEDRIGTRVKHPRAAILDHLLDRGTRRPPAERCTMQEIADELRSWLSAGERVSEIPDVDAALRIASAYTSQRIVRQEVRMARTLAVHEFARQILSLLRPLENRLKGKDGLTVELRAAADHLEWLGQIPPEYQGCYVACEGPPDPQIVTLRSGVVVFLDGERVRIKAIHSVQWGPTAPEIVWSQEQGAPLGSALANERLGELVAELESALPRAVTRFAERLREQSELAGRQRDK